MEAAGKCAVHRDCDTQGENIKASQVQARLVEYDPPLTVSCESCKNASELVRKRVRERERAREAGVNLA